MRITDISFSELPGKLLEHLAVGHCVSIVGLSNSGKSTLLRAMTADQAAKIYASRADRPALLIYIDCNRAVEISSQAFYEVVLRSILEHLADERDGSFGDLRDAHQTVTEANNAFAASLSFNLALSELCNQLDKDLCLFFDEFDEIYRALDDRALLNLRALRDRFEDQLAFATATTRSLPVLRGQTIEDEFAELFSRFTYGMPLLNSEEAETVIEELEISDLPDNLRSKAVELSGGHPGILVALAQSLVNLPDQAAKDPVAFVRFEPQPRAECLKLWNQLTEDERESLVTLVLNPKSGLPRQQTRHLSALGMLREGKIFSPIFAEFVSRRGRSPDVDAQGVYLDSDSGDVWVDGIRVPVLTDLEYRLLELLYERRDKLTDKYQIVTAVWGEEYLGDVDDARVEKLISRLRSKVEPDPSEPCYIITRRGRGYKLLSKPRST
ncbi:MAG: winged helix-turn-helix domain-containing protein [Anaerolineales bacterium]|jgi:DNA-binding winged helix-turn-helix (wHTH) protein/ABC-type thiamine transport system ATPase subunit